MTRIIANDRSDKKQFWEGPVRSTPLYLDKDKVTKGSFLEHGVRININRGLTNIQLPHVAIDSGSQQLLKQFLIWSYDGDTLQQLR